jgi:hypothetical protein
MLIGLSSHWILIIGRSGTDDPTGMHSDGLIGTMKANLSGVTDGKAIAFAAVMLVAGQLYIENRSARLPAVPAALMASVPWDKPSPNLPQ